MLLKLVLFNTVLQTRKSRSPKYSGLFYLYVTALKISAGSRYQK